MPANRSLRRCFLVALLAMSFFVSDLPAYAAPPHRRFATLGEEAVAWIHELLGNWWRQGAVEERASQEAHRQQKEGVTIDPDGQKEGVPSATNGSH